MNKLYYFIFGLVVCVSSSLLSAQDAEEIVAADADEPTVFTIEDCVVYALQHSPELKRRSIDHEDRLLDEIIARSGFDFRLNYDGSYDTSSRSQGNTLRLSKEIIGGINVSTTGQITKSHERTGTDSGSWSVRLSKQILGGGSILETRNAIDDSLIDITIALNNISREKRELVSRVRRAFYQVIRDTQSLSIQERRLERARVNLEHAKERERPLDIITAEIQVPENELSVVQRKRNIDTGKDRLKELMGMEITKELSLDLTFDFKISEVDVKSDILYSLESNEDFLNNRLSGEKIDKDIIIQRRQVWPDLTLSAEHRANSETNAINLRGEDEQIYSLSFSWPLGSRRDYSEYLQEKNRLERNELDHFTLKQSKVSRLLNLSRQLDEIEQSIALQERRLELVGFQVELFKDRWENGEIDILELVRSENDLEDTKVELVNLKVRYLDQLSEYEFEVGR